MKAISGYYLAMADAETAAYERPESRFMGLTDPSVAAFRCFRRYSKGATFDMADAEGRVRWMTGKQMRVAAILERLALGDGRGKMSLIASEALVSPSTVTRVVLRMQAWGLLAVDVTRGRNGGIRVWKPVGERFRLYAIAARQKLRDMAFRARIKLSSLIQGGGTVSDTSTRSRDESFSRQPMSFASRVLYERAMLALEDPEGEYEAVRTITDVDNALLLAQDERRRQDEEIREAAFRGDWGRWEQLRADRWEE